MICNNGLQPMSFAKFLIQLYESVSNLHVAEGIISSGGSALCIFPHLVPFLPTTKVNNICRPAASSNADP